ncbi:unnamed protein product [Cyclocybe aegerita]|uniref:Uncharacterized protein n=1 Tax=Cyclocybe aegerita TaxID=1973307 RepID=A0A8S0VV63_CYCAE|nr:unnamed protein product [Cyclocybe aegerita]
MDTRPPPPQGKSPFSSARRRRKLIMTSLRPVVITVAVLGGIWSLFSGIGFFRNAPIYSDNGSSKLSLLSIIVGVLYMVVMGIEIFGIFAASTQKLVFVRIYAYLAGLVVLIIAAVGLVRVVVHFTLKDDILNVCTNATTGDTIIYTGIFGPIRGGVLDAQEAAAWCKRSYDRDSWSEIVAFLITTVLAMMFAVVAFNYLRQVLDPTSPVNNAREPQRFGSAFPSHYNPPYNPNMPYGGQYGGAPGYYQSYPAPAGPPPHQSTDAFVPPYPGKPPGFVGGDDTKDGYQKHDDGPSEERDVTTRTPNPFR